jgi:hypothetical protein
MGGGGVRRWLMTVAPAGERIALMLEGDTRLVAQAFQLVPRVTAQT